MILTFSDFSKIFKEKKIFKEESNDALLEFMFFIEKKALGLITGISPRSSQT